MLCRRLLRCPLVALVLLCAAAPLQAQTPLAHDAGPTRADTLRGSITPERAWWDVTFYDLHVAVSPADSSIRGSSAVTYRVVDAARVLQLDLQAPLVLDSVVQRGRRLAVRHDGAAHFVAITAPQVKGALETVTAYYHGRPRVAKRAPWDGGFVWTAGQPRQRLGRHGRAGPRRERVVADERHAGRRARLAARRHHGAERDDGRVERPPPSHDAQRRRHDHLRVGRRATPSTTTTWPSTPAATPTSATPLRVNPAPLTLDFYPLAYHEAKARRHFAQDVKPMLACFEGWFGPYPWYEDGYKLVETPHLGMEHQSAVAYGNHYGNGYLGRDLSRTGRGLTWDFIVVHESAHEWWGNSITTDDVADMWVHEAFANYAENLYVECRQGKAAGR